jgi:hypothetical protein
MGRADRPQLRGRDARDAARGDDAVDRLRPGDRQVQLTARPAVQDLQAVTDAIQAHFSNRMKQGNLTKLEQFIVASNAAENPTRRSRGRSAALNSRATWTRSTTPRADAVGPVRSGDAHLHRPRRPRRRRARGGAAHGRDRSCRSGLTGARARGAQRLRRRARHADPWRGAADQRDRAEGGQGDQRARADRSATAATRKMVLGWNTIGHMVAHYAKQFPQLALYAKAHWSAARRRRGGRSCSRRPTRSTRTSSAPTPRRRRTSAT